MVSKISLNNSTQSRISIYSFKGIPFAEAPIGYLRFQRPEEKTYSEPISIDATKYRSPCVQLPVQNLPSTFGRTSEDCLFLNIWTPTLNESANLPVMFYIYGGTFIVGSGSASNVFIKSLGNIYDGSLLAIRDVIVITSNYRLGAFGFLYGNSSDCPGNVGLWDQAMALNWTIQNIKSFGGNPNNITLFGESAGSISVSYHIVSNVSRNWFQRAIMQSGAGYVKLFSRDKDYSYSLARRFASNSTLFKTGSCSDTNTWIECLRNKSAKEILLAQTTAILWNPTNPWYFAYLFPFIPMYEDFYDFMPKSINKAVKEGDFRKDINLLIGHNELEGAFFTLGWDILRFLEKRYIPQIPLIPFPVITKHKVYNDIKNIFINNNSFDGFIANEYTQTFTDEQLLLSNSDGNRLRRTAVHAFGDYFLTCPTILFGYYVAKHQIFNKHVFQYKLTYANSRSLCAKSVWANVTHGDDLTLIFGIPFVKTIFFNNSDRKLSSIMMDIWTDFAKNDVVPEVNGNVWPPYSRDNIKYLELHPNNDRLGRVFTNAYDGIDDGYDPSVINNCLNIWDEIISEAF